MIDRKWFYRPVADVLIKALILLHVNKNQRHSISQYTIHGS